MASQSDQSDPSHCSGVMCQIWGSYLN